MALSSGYKKITRTQKQSDGNYKKISDFNVAKDRKSKQHLTQSTTSEL